MAVQEDTVLSVENLQVSIGQGDHSMPVVRGLSYQLKKGQVLAVVGESGCGKTLHALSLLRLLPPGVHITGGQILYQGKNICTLPNEELRHLRGHKIAMVFQDPMTSLNPIRTIGKQLTETILAHRPVSLLKARAMAVRLLKKVGIAQAKERLNQYPFQFSGGQRQRIMIAMALCLHPEVLIADEPTTALDVTIQAQILKLIKQLQRQSGMSAVFITHNLALVADIADEVLVLYSGYCVEKASVQELFSKPLHPYTKGLLGSLVSLTHKMDHLPAIEGYPPAPGFPKQGCPFAPRCPYVTEKCRQELPSLDSVQNHQVRCWRAEEL